MAKDMVKEFSHMRKLRIPTLGFGNMGISMEVELILSRKIK